ncbi:MULTISPECIES: metallophosphoesterase family protein [unclassified Haladaptatus]|uniref:metallophosphoesterase family protein n=1 Tax=unclassified Haladaptatus TaxID=2622732 RepID=UPI00209BCD3E|nr:MULTISPECIES: metallophosphoesterase family protein [unclassified Haladaptatus]MCO8245245.1 metallophosphatase family protein [Haladaptatus sp. AB643]MCO8253389.1 metallophosphatase family protein [Haladaptatus sp. AB618]
MEVAILSDMHIPGQAERIPDAFREHIEAADHVVHAGDFGSEEALADVQALTSDLTGVYGNADPNDIDLPPVASVEVDGLTFVVLHGIINPVERAVSSSEGVVMNRDDWLNAIADTTRARADEPMVGIGGHTHQVEDTVHDGVRLLNPGSATGVGPDVDATMMTVEVTDGELDVTLHEG